MDIFKRKNKITTNITVVDDNKDLPDVRKISVPDLKQYLIDGYKEIREVKKEKENLKEELEEAGKYKILYESALVTLEEFKKRDEENKEKIEKLDENIKNKNEYSNKLEEKINDYKIKEEEINKQLENSEKIIQENNIKAVKNYKDNLINEINNYRGNISKSKLFNIIEGIK